MRQHGKSFLQEAENQENGDGIAVAWDRISGRGDSERGCEGYYISSRFRFCGVTKSYFYNQKKRKMIIVL